MKIAISTRHGGFGLSDKAFEKLLDLKGVLWQRIEDTAKYFSSEYYTAGHLEEAEHYLSQLDYTDNRDDLDLINVIETMGSECNTRYSSIKIVEIPDDVDWYIEEYDGAEWVAEKHRTWHE